MRISSKIRPNFIQVGTFFRRQQKKCASRPAWRCQFWKPQNVFLTPQAFKVHFCYRFIPKPLFSTPQAFKVHLLDRTWCYILVFVLLFFLACCFAFLLLWYPACATNKLDWWQLCLPHIRPIVFFWSYGRWISLCHVSNMCDTYASDGKRVVATHMFPGSWVWSSRVQHRHAVCRRNGGRAVYPGVQY